jgi:hypothetical protein
MQCNAMQCNAMQCNAMQCNAMQCNASPLIQLCTALEASDDRYKDGLRGKKPKNIVKKHNPSHFAFIAIFHWNKIL